MSKLNQTKLPTIDGVSLYDVSRALERIRVELITHAVELDDDAKRVLDNNRWDLYDTD